MADHLWARQPLPTVRRVYRVPADRPVNEALIGEIQKGQRRPRRTTRFLRGGQRKAEIRARRAPALDVVGARILARYLVEVTFENCEVRVIDMEPYLQGPGFDRMRRGYSYFRQLRVDPHVGTVAWLAGERLSARRLYVESKPAIPG